MVLVSDKPSNDIGILQTKTRHREGHEARRVGLETMPLDQHIEGGHGERQARLKIGPAPMHHLFKRTIRLKARIIFTRHDVIMLWWVLDMTHRQTAEPGWNDPGVALARWDSLQTDDSGCRGLLVSCV